MSISLYFDHQVRLAIAEGLRQRGVDQDDDFLAIAAQWLREGKPFAGLVYAHQLSITVGQAVRDLELIAKTLDPEDMRNRVEFIPL